MAFHLDDKVGCTFSGERWNFHPAYLRREFAGLRVAAPTNGIWWEFAKNLDSKVTVFYREEARGERN